MADSASFGSKAIVGAEYIMLPREDLEYLQSVLKQLQELIFSHVEPRDRDLVGTSSALDSPVHWICETELADLREQVRTVIEDSAQENREYRMLLLGEIPASREDQLLELRRWLAGGALN